MYTPDHYKSKNQEEIFNFISENGFGMFITQKEGKLFATNIPMVIEKTAGRAIVLTGHISSENPQVQTFADDINALAVFNGPHAYVSSSWYSHENVSTWNYIAAQASGKLKLLSELELIESLIGLTAKYESKEQKPKYVENIEPRVIRENLSGIKGFRILVDSLEASYKLSQNRNDTDHRNIISKLEARNDVASSAVAAEMKKRRTD